MEEFYVDVYKREVLKQIASADLTFKKINELEWSRDLESLFMYINFFLIAVSHVFNILYPVVDKDKFKAFRARTLKQKYNLPDIDRRIITIRNDFEHFDERIDDWVLKSPRHNFIDNNVGDYSSIAGSDEIDRFRHYNPKDKSVYFRGFPYNIKELKDILDSIYSKLQS